MIVNTGDDFEHLGLKISPDVDTVMYTLADLADPEKGWGRADESWHCLETLGEFGGPTWFRLGDKDMALHLERTRRLNQGDRLSQITREFCTKLGIQSKILPMTDSNVATFVLTDEGELAFQTYFVALQCEPEVRGFRFEGIHSAKPAPGVIKALREADLIIFCPSNPWVSVDPILALPGITNAVRQKTVIGVSPIVGGRALKGPAARMYQQLGLESSAQSVAEHYKSILHGFVIDQVDHELESSVQELGIRVCVTQTIMRNEQDRKQLAETILHFSTQL